MPFLPCRHPFECGRWFDISWSKPLSTRRTRLFDRNRGESSPFHSSRHPDNLPLTFLPNFSSFSLSLSFSSIFIPFFFSLSISYRFSENLDKFSKVRSKFIFFFFYFGFLENLDTQIWLLRKYLHLRLRLFLLPSSILASLPSWQKFE